MFMNCADLVVYLAMWQDGRLDQVEIKDLLILVEFRLGLCLAI